MPWTPQVLQYINFFDPLPKSGFENVFVPHIDFVVIAVGHIEFPESGGEVMDNLNILHALFDDAFLCDAPNDDVRSPLPQFFGLQALFVIQCRDFMTFIQKSSYQGLTREAGAP